MPTPSKFSISAATELFIGFTPELIRKQAAIIDQSFEPLRKSHTELLSAIQQVEGCSEIRPSETPGGYKRRILEPLIDALKSAQSLKDS